MSIRMLIKYVAVCLLFGTWLTGAAHARYIGSYIGMPPIRSYLDAYSYYPEFQGYYPNSFYGTLNPRIGTYLPQLPGPYILPSWGLVPQPYPYYYQPPLYSPRSYVRPYYPAGPAWPHYYTWRFHTYPRSTWRGRRYGAMARQQPNVAPVGEERPSGRRVRPVEKEPNAESPPPASDETP